MIHISTAKRLPVPARMQPQGTTWVCVDCMLSDQQGEVPADHDAASPSPWALWADEPSGSVSYGQLETEHMCADREACECDYRTFSRCRCGGCGTDVEGGRFAYTYWS